MLTPTRFDPLTSFDVTPYRRVPQLPLQTLVVLTRALAGRVPADAPAYILDAAAAMTKVADAAEAAMVVRLRETNQARLVSDTEFDNAVDGLWSLLRDRVLGWQAYLRPGLERVAADPQLEIDFDELRARAERAVELAAKLFGHGPFDLTQRSFPEQRQAMANLLDLIDEDGHAPSVDALTGPELLPLLRRCQVAYEAMVDRRSGDDSGSRADLRTVRAKLQRRIVDYAALVLTLLDEQDPAASIARVEAALRPMVVLRPSRSPDDAAPDEPDPLTRASEALLRELGSQAAEPAGADA